ncbi:hypothetical protein [Streptomyces sp. NPDC017941]|uniref:nSTAND1 domain-containing NTPase n=1 Tax=Streptomyces sp. NPDC017941 TaxID=3365018 RepID=UPI003787488D
MGRRENPLDPAAGPVARFALALRVLRARAGTPTYRAMARQAPYSATAFSRAAAGEQLPSLAVTLAYAAACGASTEEWERRWRQARAEAARLPAEPVLAEAAPYRGLARFEPGDQEAFFGRGRLTDALVELTRAQRIAVVIGPSGSGKSSLLRAGFIPRLRGSADGVPPASAIRILTPGARPFDEHRERCVPAAGPGDTWLVVDQFEEVFTVCQDAPQRCAFLDLLMRARDAGSGLRVVLGVRADFYVRCLEHADLAAVLAKASLPVGPMTPEELRDVVVKPAAAAGLIVERALTARLIEEAAGQPGSLPLLSHVLLETWRRRRGRTLTVEAYAGAGGLHGAIAQSAEALYTRFTTSQAELTRLLLLRLITPGEGAQDTRRPVPRSELDLVAATPAAVDDVLDRLARGRLVTLDDHTVDLAHEALITAWPRLHAWIEDSRDHLRCHRRLTDAARMWEELGHDDGVLYRGALLATAEEHFSCARRRLELSGIERAFFTASGNARAQEQRAVARTTRRLRRSTAALAVLLALALTAGLLARDQSRRSDRERDRALDAQRVAQSRQLAAQSATLLDEDPDLASLLAVQAHRTAPTREAADSLHSALGLPLRHRLDGHAGEVRALAFSRDGRTLFAADEARTTYVWDTAGGEKRSATGTGDAVDEAGAWALSRDGRTLAVASSDDDNDSDPVHDSDTVRLIEASTGKVRHALPRMDGCDELAISPDGRTLVTGCDVGVRLWGVADGKLRTTLTGGRPEAPGGLAVSPDGRTLAVGTDDGAGLWDVATGRLRALLTGPFGSADALAFSPDGRTLATNGVDRWVWLWDTASARARSALPTGADVLAFSPDGRTLATGGYGAAQLWDVRTGRRRAALAGHTDVTHVMLFSPDGRTLATGSGDKTVRLWDVGAGATRATVTHHVGRGYVSALSPDGRTLATADLYDTVHLWDAARRKRRSRLTGHTRDIKWVVFSPNSRTLATGSVDDTVRLWDVRTGRSRAVLAAESWAGTFSPDGASLAFSDRHGDVRMWNVVTGERRAVHRAHTFLLAFSPDGRTLATGSEDHAVRLRSATTGRTRTVLRGHTAALTNMVFSRDGRTLATRGDDSTVRLWDVATGKARKTVIRRSAGITALAFGPGGQVLMAASASDFSVRLWDVETGEARTTFTGHTDSVDAVAFSPDARTLITSGDDGTVRLWKVDLPAPAVIVRTICGRIHRDLTRLEHSIYLPDRPARPVCSF